MPTRPPQGVPAVGDRVRMLHLAGPEDGVVVAVEDSGRLLRVEGAGGVVAEFHLRRASGLYTDDRWTRLAFD